MIKCCVTHSEEQSYWFESQRPPDLQHQHTNTRDLPHCTAQVCTNQHTLTYHKITSSCPFYMNCTSGRWLSTDWEWKGLKMFWTKLLLQVYLLDVCKETKHISVDSSSSEHSQIWFFFSFSFVCRHQWTVSGPDTELNRLLFFTLFLYVRLELQTRSLHAAYSSAASYTSDTWRESEKVHRPEPAVLCAVGDVAWLFGSSCTSQQLTLAQGVWLQLVLWMTTTTTGKNNINFYFWLCLLHILSLKFLKLWFFYSVL